MAAHGLQAEVDARVEMFTAEKEEQLLSGNPTFVLDAIDNIDTKVSTRENQGLCTTDGCQGGSGPLLAGAPAHHSPLVPLVPTQQCLQHKLTCPRSHAAYLPTHAHRLPWWPPATGEASRCSVWRVQGPRQTLHACMLLT
jgi:hypothetical protein